MVERSPAAMAIGILNVVLGAVLLLVTFDAWRPPLAVIGPAVIVVVGVALVLGGIHLRRPRPGVAKDPVWTADPASSSGPDPAAVAPDPLPPGVEASTGHRYDRSTS